MSSCSIVRLLNQGDVKLHDVFIDGVYDTSANSPYLDHGIYAVRVGDTRMYGPRHATKEETYNITIRNVYHRGVCAIAFAGEIQNLVMHGIECGEDCKMLFDARK